MTSHILWQNASRTVTLIDLPRSIIDAQGFNSPDEHELLSSQPRDAPYPSCEPKTAAARAKLVDNTVDQDLHAEYRELLIQSLHEVRQHYSGEWCVSRPFVEEAGPRKKRKLDDGDDVLGDRQHGISAEDRSKTSLPDHFLSSFARGPTSALAFRTRIQDEPDGTEVAGNGAPIGDHFYSNNGGEHDVLSIPKSTETKDEMLDFRIPPDSSFYLGDCTASANFRKSFRQHAKRNNTKATFDFILLDPPWPNRSIKRTHKTAGATYQTTPTLEGLGDMILDMQLDGMMAEGALVGVWITNKQAARELVLGLGGLFELWGVELVEEWVWLKTTTAGEPTSAVDAMWKKPYEILLLGRKRGRTSTSGETETSLERRVIIGVPDLHSRKPCLKGLIEPLMPDPEQYAALEVFARHLVAGWCSWGDECIKFNWEGFWREREGER